MTTPARQAARPTEISPTEYLLHSIRTPNQNSTQTQTNHSLSHTALRGGVEQSWPSDLSRDLQTEDSRMSQRPEWGFVTAAAAVVCLTLAHATRPAAGAITYVDADPGPTGNTVNSSTNSTTDFWTATDPGVGDDKWTNRAFASPAVNGGDVLESFVPYPENSPQVTTTIGGLNAGSAYRVYVVYVANSGAAWNL